MHRGIRRSLISLFALAFLFAAHGKVNAAPKAAVMYSAWGSNSFQHEYDEHLKALGWQYEALENKDIASWIGRLDQFDVVIAASVSNYEQPQDMAPYREAWLRFLQRGGVLLITDASYGSVLDQWVNRLGPEFALATNGCAPHTKKNGGSAAITADPSHPLLHIPNELPPLFRAKGGIWAHMEPRGTGWQKLITCADGQCLYAARPVGRGVLAVASYFSFKGTTAQDLATGILDNLWTYAQGQKADTTVTAFTGGAPLPGKQQATLACRNTGATPAVYAVALTLTEGKGKPVTVARMKAVAAPGGTARFTLPYQVTRRGEQCLHVALAREGQPALTLERRQVVPPLLTFQLKDRHRYPGDRALAFSAAFAPEAGIRLAECTAELLLDNRPALRLPAPKPNGEYRVSIMALPLGSHRASLLLRHEGKTLGTATEEFFRHPAARVASRADGTTLVDGKPFFPFGWYHVSWPYTTAERLECLRVIAAGGFNTLHAGIKQLDEWDPFLDEAQKLGVHVISEFGTEPLAVIRRYRKKPAVLAWNPGDEPDGQGVSPAEMLRRYDRFKTADPDHPTYMVLCVPSAYARYAGCAEIIAPDPYPIPGSPIRTVYNSLSAARKEAARYGRPVWGVLQCFGYAKGPWRVPTFSECRNMTYQALLAGVKGIIYYTYADNDFRMREHPELWAEMRTLPPEIEQLRPFLLDGKATPLKTGSPDILAGIWTVRGRTVLCVVNTAEKESREAALPLPAGRHSAAPLFPARPKSLTAQNGKLNGKLAPLAVELYVVK